MYALAYQYNLKGEGKISCRDAIYVYEMSSRRTTESHFSRSHHKRDRREGTAGAVSMPMMVTENSSMWFYHKGIPAQTRGSSIARRCIIFEERQILSASSGSRLIVGIGERGK